MNTRSVPRLDYKILHESGPRYGPKTLKMSTHGEIVESDVKTLSVTELKICEDLRHIFRIYQVDELESDEELNEAFECISETSQKYRHVHVPLIGKNEDGFFKVSFKDRDFK